MVVLLNGVYYSVVVEPWFVSSIILSFKSKFSRVMLCVAVEYDLEGKNEKRKRFWDYLDRVLDRIGNEYRFCVMGDLSG